MKINEPISKGILIKRYNRFLADIKLDNGENITAHCPNTGSMKQCKDPGSEVIVSLSGNDKRKYPHTWQMIKVKGLWCCVNTIFANKLAGEAIRNNVIPQLSGYNEILAEQKYGENSRIDFLLKNEDELCYVEVKNVTLTDGKDTAIFPDAVTSRGQKHLKELMKVVRSGSRAVMLYVIQRQEAKFFDTAGEIDPEYDRLLQNAIKTGVEVICMHSSSDGTDELYLKKELTFKKRK